jgi:DNA-directed RNA polymerase specialized sigma24 family protein
MSTDARVRRLRGATRQDLPERFANEDLEVFYGQVFLPLVRRVTWKHRLSREDARDIVQDAFVLALTRLDGRGNPKAWLIQVVDHLSMNHRRKVMRRASLRQRWGEGDKTQNEGGTRPDDDEC